MEQRQLTWPSTLYDGTEPSEPRSVLLVTVQTETGADICVGSAHLSRGSATARSQALARLTALTDSLPLPWVICGDFNTPSSTWLEPEGPFSIAPYDGQPSYPADRPHESIDYAVAGPGVFLSARVLSVRGSDHLPVLVLANVERNR